MKHNAHIVNVNHTKQWLNEMKCLGISQEEIKRKLPNYEQYTVKVQNVTLKEANNLKNALEVNGGEVFLPKEKQIGESFDMLLFASKKQWLEIINEWEKYPLDDEQMTNEIIEVLKGKNQLYGSNIVKNKKKELVLDKRTLIMGILNVTPDSFSDGGKYINLNEAIVQAKKMVEDGADIIDVGGESTRPGHEPVSLEEELERVIPIIEKLSREINVPISIDTYKSEVAKKALDAGADIINDVWGFKKDVKMARIAADYDVPVILMHNREDRNYTSLMDDIISDLRESIDIGLKAGVDLKNIILDPGIGFGKSYHDNLIVMSRLEEIVYLGYPVLLGTSRKSMIGLTLNLPVTERVEGTAATVATGIIKGCKIMRVHDVKEIKRVATMMDAMINPDSRKENG